MVLNAWTLDLITVSLFTIYTSNSFTDTLAVCVVYDQNRDDSKDTLIKTSVSVRTTLLKMVFFRSKESSLPFKSYIGG